MEIIQLTGEYAKAYRELRLEALLTNPEAFITTYEQEKQRPDPLNSTAERLDSSESATFGAFDGDQLIGIVTLVQQSHPKFLHKGSIVGLYVTSSHRREGIAKQLIQTIIEHALTSSIEVLQLAVVTENKPAIRLYESLDFTVYGTEHRAIKVQNGYLDEHWMTLFLSP
ncbi:GNAT family N-acetyltransferase [Halobacillus sp. A1]|uniref:GNAT family N-acetyltransferase n=1 Tax=Halobacillus sp. A1 TaxID=2880262 RepID=UPI0020A6423E|nr:GNAT family N-acetyltransferase [Halobacillus sp. A1]MCP3032445.1 GNAT family N-acetyltransferase [Halobacillus sp. A1]